MKIQATLKEIMRLAEWETFCKMRGYDYYCLAEGADPDTLVSLTLEEAIKIGLINEKTY